MTHGTMRKVPCALLLAPCFWYLPHPLDIPGARILRVEAYPNAGYRRLNGRPDVSYKYICRQIGWIDMAKPVELVTTLDGEDARRLLEELERPRKNRARDRMFDEASKMHID